MNSQNEIHYVLTAKIKLYFLDYLNLINCISNYYTYIFYYEFADHLKHNLLFLSKKTTANLAFRETLEQFCSNFELISSCIQDRGTGRSLYLHRKEHQSLII